MFSKGIKFLFVATAYSPVILIWWSVSVLNHLNIGGTIKVLNFSEINVNNIFTRFNLIFLFAFLVFICWRILITSKNKLTRNTIEVKSIKSADLNMTPLIIGYFLPCIELYKKDNISFIGWILGLLIIIIINKSTYFYNPLMKLFGYRYYEISTNHEVTYTMISKEKLINKKNINSYSQLTDYVILNTSKK